jgi:hypothetical protein
MKDNTRATSVPTLLQTIIHLLEAHRAAFKQARPYWRGLGLVLAELFSFGRHTVAQALLSLGQTEGEWCSLKNLPGPPDLTGFKLRLQVDI